MGRELTYENRGSINSVLRALWFEPLFCTLCFVLSEVGQPTASKPKNKAQSTKDRSL
jgi:hypothetical protein